MNLRQLIDAFRSRTMDKPSNRLWSDDEITEYANEAVDEACRRANLIVDSSSAAASCDLSVGDTYIELHESVIKVRRATLASTGTPLTMIVSRTMDERVPGWELSIASTPQVAVPDWESGKLRLWPPAAYADSVLLTVVRSPLNEMSAEDDEPEIPKRYHRALVDWMLHQGYLKQDADTLDVVKAASFEERFASEFGPPSSAIDEHWAFEQYHDIGEF